MLVLATIIQEWHSNKTALKSNFGGSYFARSENFTMFLTNWQGFGTLSPLTKDASTCIVDMVSTDGLPFTHALLHRYLKDPIGPRVFLLSMQEPLWRMIRTSRRMGCDLGLAAIQGRFAALDCCCAADGTVSHFPSQDLLEAEAEQAILRSVAAFRSRREPDRSLVIFLDGLQRLAALGWAVTRILRLVRALEEMGVLVGRTTREGSQGTLLARWLVHQSCHSWWIRPLSSGTPTRMAHGEVVYREAISSGGEERTFLFKTTDTTLLLHGKEESLPLLEI